MTISASSPIFAAIGFDARLIPDKMIGQDNSRNALKPIETRFNIAGE
jgi:hypothetical protein